MFDDHLPTDPDEWPDDPFALLGVSQDADMRTVRGQYTRLIRRFKPEHHPEEFKLIRQAFELVVERHAQQHPFDTKPIEQVADPDSKVDEIWSATQDTGDDEAYRRLAEIAARSRHAEPFIRLYWLLYCNKTLDDLREPCDWLIAGFLPTQGDPRLWRLCAESLNATPENVHRIDRTTLLNTLNFGSVAFYQVFDARTRALARLERWGEIAEDLDVVRDQLSLHSDEPLLRQVMATLRTTLWADGTAGDELFESLRGQAMELSESQWNMDGELDEMDSLLELRRDFAMFETQDVSAELIALVKAVTTEPFAEIKTQIAAMVACWHQRPGVALAELDTLQRVLPMGAYLLQNAAIDYYLSEVGDQRSVPDVFELYDQMDRFLGGNKRGAAARFRLSLFEFCLSQEVTVEEVVQALWNAPAWSGSQWDTVIGSLSQDRALSCLVIGCLAFERAADLRAALIG